MERSDVVRSCEAQEDGPIAQGVPELGIEGPRPKAGFLGEGWAIGVDVCGTERLGQVTHHRLPGLALSEASVFQGEMRVALRRRPTGNFRTQKSDGIGGCVPC